MFSACLLLKSIELPGCTQVDDVSALVVCQDLHSLAMDSCYNLRDDTSQKLAASQCIADLGLKIRGNSARNCVWSMSLMPWALCASTQRLIRQRPSSEIWAQKSKGGVRSRWQELWHARLCQERRHHRVLTKPLRMTPRSPSSCC